MTLTTEHNETAGAVKVDRRRPGRIEQVNPALIPILRAGEMPDRLDDEIEFDEPDQVSGARGIVGGIAFSVPLWIVIVCLGRWIFT